MRGRFQHGHYVYFKRSTLNQVVSKLTHPTVLLREGVCRKVSGNTVTGAFTAVSGFLDQTSAIVKFSTREGGWVPPDYRSKRSAAFSSSPPLSQRAEKCGTVDWNPRETLQYDAALINRQEERHTSYTVPLYVPDKINLRGGELFIINDAEPRPSGYVGLEIEQIGAEFVVGP